MYYFKSYIELSFVIQEAVRSHSSLEFKSEEKSIFETAGRIWFLFMMANIGIYWRKFPLYIFSHRNLGLRFVKGYFDLRVTWNISAQGCFYMNNESGGKRSLSLIDLSKYQTLRSMVHIHYQKWSDRNIICLPHNRDFWILFLIVSAEWLQS